MASSYDMELHSNMSSSHKTKDVTETNKMDANDCVHRLTKIDKRNKDISDEVMAISKDLKEKESDIRYMNIENDMLFTKQGFFDQYLKNKIVDIETLHKANDEMNNAVDDILNGLKEQVHYYDAVVDNLGNQYKETSKFFDENFVTAAIEEACTEIEAIKHQILEAKAETVSLEEKLKNLKGDVPENLPAIIGKDQLEKERDDLNAELAEKQRIYGKLVEEKKNFNLRRI